MCFDTVTTCASSYGHKDRAAMSFLKLFYIGFVDPLLQKLMYKTEATLDGAPIAPYDWRLDVSSVKHKLF